MTVSAGTAKAGPYTGNNVTSSFAFSFKVFADADVRVVETLISTGIETDLVLNTDYTITRNVDQDSSPGGSITYLVSGVTAALSSTKRLTIVGDFDYEQPTDIPNGGSFFATVLENAFDRIVMFVKQLKEQADRSMRLPVSSSASVEMPMPEANSVVGWNETADALQNYSTSVFASVVAFGTASADLFDGDGTTTAFTLTSNPAALNNLDVSISGVTQTPGIDYTWTAGTTINFTTAPPVGTDNVLVRYLQGLPQGQGDAASTTYLPAGTGAVESNVRAKLREFVSAKDFGAVGDGVTDDTNALSNFLTASSGKIALIPAGTYKTTARIDVGFDNCEIVGVPGATIIQGSFGYALIKLLESSNVVFRGITFQNDYTNAAQDTASATVYSFQHSLSNIRFENCTFSIPNANGNGLIIYLNTALTDVNTCTDFSVENCTFINCGRQATTFMNRSTEVGASGFFKGLRFNNNLGKNLGMSGNFGMLISLDGVGDGFTINHNRLENFYDIGIECAAWKNGEIVGNTFDLMSRLSKPISLGPSPVSASDIPTNVSVLRNKCLSAATANSYFTQASNCLVEGNYFWTNGVDQAALVRSSINNTFRSNVYKNTHPTAARYGCLYEDTLATGCYGNKSFDETFDTSGGAGNYAPVRFYGTANVKQNVVYRPLLLKGAGGAYVDQSTGAIANLVVNATDVTNTLFDLDYFTQNFASDADMTVAIQNYSSAVVRITNAALTIGRNVILPSIIKEWKVLNATGQTLTYKAATGTGIAVATGKAAVLFWNGTNMVRVTADA